MEVKIPRVKNLLLLNLFLKYHWIPSTPNVVQNRAERQTDKHHLVITISLTDERYKSRQQNVARSPWPELSWGLSNNRMEPINAITSLQHLYRWAADITHQNDRSVSINCSHAPDRPESTWCTSVKLHQFHTSIAHVHVHKPCTCSELNVQHRQCKCMPRRKWRCHENSFRKNKISLVSAVALLYIAIRSRGKERLIIDRRHVGVVIREAAETRGMLWQIWYSTTRSGMTYNKYNSLRDDYCNHLNSWLWSPWSTNSLRRCSRQAWLQHYSEITVG